MVAHFILLSTELYLQGFEGEVWQVELIYLLLGNLEFPSLHMFALCIEALRV